MRSYLYGRWKLKTTPDHNSQTYLLPLEIFFLLGVHFQCPPGPYLQVGLQYARNVFNGYCILIHNIYLKKSWYAYYMLTFKAPIQLYLRCFILPRKCFYSFPKIYIKVLCLCLRMPGLFALAPAFGAIFRFFWLDFFSRCLVSRSLLVK